MLEEAARKYNNYDIPRPVATCAENQTIVWTKESCKWKSQFYSLIEQIVMYTKASPTTTTITMKCSSIYPIDHHVIYFPHKANA